MVEQQLLGAIAVAVAVVVLSFAMFSGWFSKRVTPAPAAPTPAPEAEKPAAKAPAAPAGQMTVFFGSQTGTAEGFAEQVKKEAGAQGFACSVVDLDDFDEQAFVGSRLAVLLLATYGEGEPTDNAAAFYKWLKAAKKDAAAGGAPLQDLHFAVFGLGNRQYEHFNKIGRDVDDFLAACGAKRAAALGVGDDDGTLEEDFESWKDALWPALREQFHPDAHAAGGGGEARGGAHKKSASAADLAALAALAPPDLPFSLSLLPAGARAADALVAPGPAPAHAQASTKHFFTAPRVKVLENRELRGPLDGGSTRHLEFEVSGAEGIEAYTTADNLAVLPENDPAAVDKLAAHMGYDLDRSFTLTGTRPGFKQAFPTPCTVREALACFVDLQGLPRRTSLKEWAPFCADARHAASLLAMAGKTPAGKARFQAEVEAPQRSLVELLTQDFNSCKVPLGALLHLAPHLQPRYYTISSSSSAHPKRIHATVAVIRAPKPGGSGGGVLQGVCSTFLARLEPPRTVSGKKADAAHACATRAKHPGGAPRPPRAWPACRAFVRASSFRLPADPKVPIVLVGPGTGIAPMRALLHERQHQRQALGGNGGNGGGVGPAVLYFGCKHPDCDFLYRDELNGFLADGTLAALHLAVSRPHFTSNAAPPAAPSPKVYVQHLIAQPANSDELWSLLDGRGGHLYVCGGTAMGLDVGKALLSVVGSKCPGGPGAAAAYVDRLKASGRYVQELWSA